MENKTCSKCNVCKPVTDFYFRKDTNDFRKHCISCEKDRLKIFYSENTESRKKSSSNYYKNNKEICSKKNREYRQTKVGKTKKKKLDKDYRQSNKDMLNLKSRLKKESNPLFKMCGNIRSLISHYFKKQNYNKSKKTIDILGCSIPEFQKHIENKFESWMNWKNHGKYNPEGERTWQLDHIIPASKAKSESELILLNHYSNFRPLCSRENNIKSNKIL